MTQPLYSLPLFRGLLWPKRDVWRLFIAFGWCTVYKFIKSTNEKLSTNDGCLWSNRVFPKVDVLKMLYFSLVHCHLKYCIVSWGTATNSVLQPLEVVHNNILRTITYNNYRCHITPVYKSLNILKLHDIYKLELAKLMHKFHHEMLPTSFKDLFQKTAEVHCHNTRLFHTTSFNKCWQKNNF